MNQFGQQPQQRPFHGSAPGGGWSPAAAGRPGPGYQAQASQQPPGGQRPPAGPPRPALPGHYRPPTAPPPGPPPTPPGIPAQNGPWPPAPPQPGRPGPGAPARGQQAPGRSGRPPAAAPGGPAPVPGPAGTPPAGGAPAPGPDAPPAPRRRKGRQWIGAVVLLVALAAVGWFVGRSAPAAANVGDCVAQTGGDDVSIVDCGDASATFKVVGRLENKTVVDAGLFACSDFPEATSSYWQGKQGEEGLVLCLAPVKAS